MSDLTVREYYEAAKRTVNEGLTWNQTRNHALHGIAAECGEIHGIYQKMYQGHPLDRGAVMDELGDLAWFWAEMCFAEEFDPEEVLRHNIEKLKKRYPAGFDPDRSVHREE